MAKNSNKLLMIIIAVLLPPLAVAIEKGFGKSLLINIILSIIGYVPGIIHAIYVVMS